MDTGDAPPLPVKAIVIMLPGYTAGATQFMFFAQDLITMADGELEIWVMDNRSNLLEDNWGMDQAEAQQDPMLAWNYYFEGQEVEGKTFAGYHDPRSPELDMMTEWGIELRMKDINLLMQKIAESNPKGTAENVILGGHSRGVRYTQMYAAYRFEDDHLGTEDLAGMLFFDGGDAKAAAPMDEDDYLDELEEMRDRTDRRFSSDWGGPSVYYRAEFLAMAAMEGWGDPEDDRLGPHGVYDPAWLGVFQLISDTLTLGNQVTLENDAFWGLMIDDEFTVSLNVFQGQMGTMTGGEICDSLGRKYPCDEQARYSWLHFDEVDPQERMDLRKLFRLTFEGPSDFFDPYYPSRFTLDDAAAGDLQTEGIDWRENYWKFATGLIDAPVLAVKGMILQGTTFYEDYRAQLADVRGNPGSPRDQVGFDIFDAPDWGHLEVLLIEPDRNPFYPEFLTWVDDWTTGTVQVPVFDH